MRIVCSTVSSVAVYLDGELLKRCSEEEGSSPKGSAYSPRTSSISSSALASASFRCSTVVCSIAAPKFSIAALASGVCVVQPGSTPSYTDLSKKEEEV